VEAEAEVAQVELALFRIFKEQLKAALEVLATALMQKVQEVVVATVVQHP
jgi:hypothetical protein